MSDLTLIKYFDPSAIDSMDLISLNEDLWLYVEQVIRMAMTLEIQVTLLALRFWEGFSRIPWEWSFAPMLEGILDLSNTICEKPSMFPAPLKR